MTSTKPQLKAYTDEVTAKKIAYISWAKSISTSQIINDIVQKYIREYEEENGEIQVPKVEE